MPTITFNVNGENRSIDIDPSTPLLWALRDSLGLTGTKYGCGIAAMWCVHRKPGRQRHSTVAGPPDLRLPSLPSR
jgi:isoquinoline 1-oxidoreductase subunit alpha